MIQGIYTPDLVPFRADERINEDLTALLPK